MNIKSGDEMVKKKLVAKRLGRTVKSLERYIKKNPDFPKCFKDGNAKQSPVYFIDSEVTAYINDCFGRNESSG